jgi:hypothetical protein
MISKIFCNFITRLRRWQLRCKTQSLRGWNPLAESRAYHDNGHRPVLFVGQENGAGFRVLLRRFHQRFLNSD